MISRTFIILLMVAFPCVWGRTFTDQDGKQFEAEIVGRSSGHVLLMSNGNIQKFPLNKLSQADQSYVATFASPQVTPANTNKPTIVDRRSKRLRQGDAPHGQKRQLRSYRSEELKSSYRLVDNYAQDWPKTTYVNTPSIHIVSEDKNKQRYVYHSPNYEFISNEKLSMMIVSKFAHQFEATREYCSKIPLSLMLARLPGEQHRNRIYLFKNQKDYYQSGGMPGSAGVFKLASNEVLIPLTSLGVVERSGVLNYDPTKANFTITHELVHQLTDSELYNEGARGWFTEGLAEYCAATPYQSGRYTLNSNQYNVFIYVTGHGRNNQGGRVLGTKIKAPDLKVFMLQSYNSFLARGNESYGLALLVTYYFIHMEADRRNLNQFLMAMKRGDTGEAAVKHLLNGRSFEQLENDIQKAWRACGVNLEFR